MSLEWNKEVGRLLELWIWWYSVGLIELCSIKLSSERKDERKWKALSKGVTWRDFHLFRIPLAAVWE